MRVKKVFLYAMERAFPISLECIANLNYKPLIKYNENMRKVARGQLPEKIFGYESEGDILKYV